MVLAIDFDGVIHDHLHPKPGRSMGPPLPGAKEALDMFKASGAELYIFTVWPPSRHRAIHEWMAYYSMPSLRITNVKEPADHYIDDRAIHFTSWEQVIGDLRGQDSLPNWQRRLGDPR